MHDSAPWKLLYCLIIKLCLHCHSNNVFVIYSAECKRRAFSQGCMSFILGYSRVNSPGGVWLNHMYESLKEEEMLFLWIDSRIIPLPPLLLLQMEFRLFPNTIDSSPFFFWLRWRNCCSKWLVNPSIPSVYILSQSTFHCPRRDNC